MRNRREQKKEVYRRIVNAVGYLIFQWEQGAGAAEPERRSGEESGGEMVVVVVVGGQKDERGERREARGGRRGEKPSTGPQLRCWP